MKAITSHLQLLEVYFCAFNLVTATTYGTEAGCTCLLFCLFRAKTLWIYFQLYRPLLTFITAYSVLGRAPESNLSSGLGLASSSRAVELSYGLLLKEARKHKPSVHDQPEFHDFVSASNSNERKTAFVLLSLNPKCMVMLQTCTSKSQMKRSRNVMLLKVYLRRLGCRMTFLWFWRPFMVSLTYYPNEDKISLFWIS